jgi:predicted site-specific integrase-resolvase
MDARHMTPREVAQKLGIRLDATYSLIWAGKLIARKSNGKWFVLTDSVQKRLKEREARNG